MRRSLLTKLILVSLVAIPLFALAEDNPVIVKVLGEGNEVELDPRTIPVEMQAGYLAMKTFCVSCHGQERVITTLRTGISPVTKHPYGMVEFDDKIIKIMRSPKAHLDRTNAKTLTEFFHFLIKKTKLS